MSWFGGSRRACRLYRESSCPAWGRMPPSSARLPQPSSSPDARASPTPSRRPSISARGCRHDRRRPLGTGPSGQARAPGPLGPTCLALRDAGLLRRARGRAHRGIADVPRPGEPAQHPPAELDHRDCRLRHAPDDHRRRLRPLGRRRRSGVLLRGRSRIRPPGHRPGRDRGPHGRAFGRAPERCADRARSGSTRSSRLSGPRSWSPGSCSSPPMPPRSTASPRGSRSSAWGGSARSPWHS